MEAGSGSRSSLSWPNALRPRSLNGAHRDGNCRCQQRQCAIQAKASVMSTSSFTKRLERIEQAISPNRPRAFEGICSSSSDPVVAAQIEAEKFELMKQLGVRDDDLVVWLLSFAHEACSPP